MGHHLRAGRQHDVAAAASGAIGADGRHIRGKHVCAAQLHAAAVYPAVDPDRAVGRRGARIGHQDHAAAIAGGAAIGIEGPGDYHIARDRPEADRAAVAACRAGVGADVAQHLHIVPRHDANAAAIARNGCVRVDAGPLEEGGSVGRQYVDAAAARAAGGIYPAGIGGIGRVAKHAHRIAREQHAASRQTAAADIDHATPEPIGKTADGNGAAGSGQFHAARAVDQGSCAQRAAIDDGRRSIATDRGHPHQDLAAISGDGSSIRGDAVDRRAGEFAADRRQVGHSGTGDGDLGQAIAEEVQGHLLAGAEHHAAAGRVDVSGIGQRGPEEADGAARARGDVGRIEHAVDVIARQRGIEDKAPVGHACVEAGIADVHGRRDQAAHVDLRATAEGDPGPVDQEHAAGRGQAAVDAGECWRAAAEVEAATYAITQSNHAVEGHAIDWLAEREGIASPDVERAPIDDSAPGGLGDRQSAVGLIVEIVDLAAGRQRRRNRARCHHAINWQTRCRG